MANKKGAGGRPSKYKEEYAEMARKMCLMGADDKKLADVFEVSESTINKWKLDYPKFSESLKKGKDLADAEIADALFHRAKGYSHPEEKVFCSEGEITTHETTKHYPPDTAAAFIWLKNRQSDYWRDKKEEHVEHYQIPTMEVVVNQPKDLDEETDERVSGYLQ